jgi:regulator of RNase E activity RraA
MKQQVSLYPGVTSHDLDPAEEARLLDLCEQLKALTGGSAACSDALDALGYRRCAMGPQISPYFPEKGRMVGLAYTIRGSNVTGLPANTDEVRETVDVEYFDGIRPGYVLAYGTDAADRGTIIGDVISTFATSRGAVGAVLDGPIRDLERIRPLDFRPFGPAAAPVSGEGRVLWIEYNCIVQIGGVWVEPFDIIYGDEDGVVVIPKTLAEDVLRLAADLCAKEDAIKESFLANRDLPLLAHFAAHGRRP